MVGRTSLGDDGLRGQITIPLTRASLDKLAMDAEKAGKSRTVHARELLLAGLGLKETAHG